VYSPYIQKLSIEQPTWEVMELQLPQPASCIPCFKGTSKDSQAYFVISSVLYAFRPEALQIEEIRVFPKDIKSFFGPCYHSRDNLNYSKSTGAAGRLTIGVLS
jgi:hypothetical protein